jgi:hypothetical protein
MSTTFDPQILRQLMAEAEKAPNTHEQGHGYERALRYIFEAAGCLVEQNQTNIGGAEEVDLGIGNLGPFALLPRIFLVESKDWDRPVDSKTVGYFLNIVHSRSLELAIVVAPKGITGDHRDMTYAHSLGAAAAAHNVKIVVITTEDLLAITCTTDFVTLLHRRYLRATVNGGVGVPQDGDHQAMRQHQT